jgi:hypothetical protein
MQSKSSKKGRRPTSWLGACVVVGRGMRVCSGSSSSFEMCGGGAAAGPLKRAQPNVWMMGITGAIQAVQAACIFWQRMWVWSTLEWVEPPSVAAAVDVCVCVCVCV